MKKLTLSLFTVSVIIFSCRKESTYQLNLNIASAISCVSQTADPSLRSYPCDSLIPNFFPVNHCGFLPLSLNNFWVYEDSFFNNGTFLRVQIDTLQFIRTNQTTTDKLIWWDSNIDIGIPIRLYSNEIGIYNLEKRLFTSCTWEANKEFVTPAGDSAKYLTRFEDIAAQGRSLKLNEIISTPAGDFGSCIYFEKYARNFRKDQVFIKPGIGVVKYIREVAPMGHPVLKLQQISTLREFYLE